MSKIHICTSVLAPPKWLSLYHFNLSCLRFMRYLEDFLTAPEGTISQWISEYVIADDELLDPESDSDEENNDPNVYCRVNIELSLIHPLFAFFCNQQPRAPKKRDI